MVAWVRPFCIMLLSVAQLVGHAPVLLHVAQHRHDGSHGCGDGSCFEQGSARRSSTRQLETLATRAKKAKTANHDVRSRAFQHLDCRCGHNVKSSANELRSERSCRDGVLLTTNDGTGHDACHCFVCNSRTSPLGEIVQVAVPACGTLQRHEPVVVSRQAFESCQRATAIPRAPPASGRVSFV